MCYELKCTNCGKTTWGGCGSHVPAVHARIPQGQHCLCKGWPGVNHDDDDNHSKAPSANFCTIL